MNSPPQPPKLADRFLAWFCKPELLEEIQGDLHADYERNCKTNGEWRANRYWIQVLNFIRPFALKRTKTSNNIGMLRNHFKIAFRIFRKEKTHSFINLSGLVLGFTCCLLIALFIGDELSYDNFHQDGERIYRVAASYKQQGEWRPH